MSARNLSRARAYPLLGLATTLLCALACNQVLGIEDATLASAGAANGNDGGNSAGLDSVGGRPNGLTGGVGGGGAANGNDGGTSANGGSISVGGAAAGSDPGTNGGTTASAGEGGEAGDSPLGEAGQGGADGGSLCDEYCDTLDENCQGEEVQYFDRAQCLTVCAMFPAGENNLNANTVSCRLKRAAAVRYTAPGPEHQAQCRSAGPGGDGFCGTNCEGLCSVTMSTCTAESSPFDYYTSFDKCMSACAGVPQVNYVFGDPNVSGGNTVQCRTIHAISAAMTAPDEHCSHAMGKTACVP